MPEGVVKSRALVSGGVKLAVKPIPWFPIGVAEDESERYCEAERLTSARLQEMVKNFDFRGYRPPIFGGPNESFNTHQAEAELTPLGWVTELAYVAGALWARGEQLMQNGVGALDALVSAGYIDRSLRAWCELEGFDGAVLRHVAFIGNEPSGQLGYGMPSVVPFFVSQEAARTLGAGSEITRVFGHGPEEEESMALTEADIIRIVGVALAPITTSITTLQTQVTGAVTAAESARTALSESQYRGELARLVSEGRLRPAELEGEAKLFPVLTEVLRTERLAELGNRAPVVTPVAGSQSARTAIVVAEGVPAIDPLSILPPGTQIHRCQPAELQEFAAAVHSAGLTAADMQEMYRTGGSPKAIEMASRLQAALQKSTARTFLPPQERERAL